MRTSQCWTVHPRTSRGRERNFSVAQATCSLGLCSLQRNSILMDLGICLSPRRVMRRQGYLEDTWPRTQRKDQTGRTWSFAACHNPALLGSWLFRFVTVPSGSPLSRGMLSATGCKCPHRGGNGVTFSIVT